MAIHAPAREGSPVLAGQHSRNGADPQLRLRGFGLVVSSVIWMVSISARSLKTFAQFAIAIYACTMLLVATVWFIRDKVRARINAPDSRESDHQ